MSEKYIDLKSEISRMRDSFEMKVGIVATLNWLDEHPNQAPGRTITESELESSVVHARQCASFTTNPVGFVRSALDILGITVIPDPEPTNAEKLKAVLDAIGDSTAGYRKHLASKLDEAGVKAPGGDE